ncbi:hypothetical protein [Auritidibacter sp. NML100628]|uniref:hypothetical protein n=1 Tax=Auritidibacter sp. NML100628 TaxID=2170742 RepID=UPI000D725BB5|nr:hypothetical protein [Auritidibacter sp. NML100628]PXA77905.1 hypothetical protein DCC24_03155 [Auritidibacter sp. NML100628]
MIDFKKCTEKLAPYAHNFLQELQDKYDPLPISYRLTIDVEYDGYIIFNVLVSWRYSREAFYKYPPIVMGQACETPSEVNDFISELELEISEHL